MGTIMGVLALVAFGGLTVGLLFSSSDLIVAGAIALCILAVLAGNTARNRRR